MRSQTSLTPLYRLRSALSRFRLAYPKMREDAPHCDHSLREVFNGLCSIARTGMQWRFMPNDLPPWYTVYPQTRRPARPATPLCCP